MDLAIVAFDRSEVSAHDRLGIEPFTADSISYLSC
jgi:hypothetical protein